MYIRTVETGIGAEAISFGLRRQLILRFRIRSYRNMHSSLKLSLLSPLLFLFLGSIRPSSSAALPTHSSDRWRNPCAGKTPAYGVSFLELSTSSAELKAMVNSLRNDYNRHMEAIALDPYQSRPNILMNQQGPKMTIRARFNGEEPTSEIFDIPGSPSWSASSDSMNETLLTCYENLARLAVLTRLTREAEEMSTRDREFAPRFQTIKDDAYSGLYVIMCNLDNAMASLNIEVMSPETIMEVSSIRFEEGLSEASRHVRDYVVLRVLETSAEKLSSNFKELNRQVHSKPKSSTTE